MNKHKIILIISIIVVILFSFFSVAHLNEVNSLTSQVVWQKTYGGSEDDRAFYAIDNSEGYLVIGSTKSSSENTTLGWAIQIDSEGNTIWNKTYLTGIGTELRCALNLTDGYLLVGNEYLKGNVINGFVTKTDNEGNVVWRTTFDNKNVDKLFSAIQAPDGFILLGSTFNNENNISVAWAVKLDLDGQILWNNDYLKGTESTIRQGILAPDGSYICAGYTKSSDYQFLVLKIDPTGKLVWNQTYGQESSQKAYSITEVNDGCVIVGDKVSLTSDSDAWVIKIDWNGILMWERTIGGKDADSAAVVSSSEDGNYLVSGFTFSYGEGNRDVWLFKISNAGDVVWSCTVGDRGYQEAYQVFDAGKNQYMIFGWTDPPKEPELIGKAQYDFYVAKINP